MKQITKTVTKDNNLGDEVVLKQYLSFSGIVVVLLPILFLILLLNLFNSYFAFLFLICAPILGMNFEYVICKSYQNRRIFRTFNFPLYSQNKSILYPEYITIMRQGSLDGTGSYSKSK